MAADWNAVIKLHKVEKSNVEIVKRLDMNRSTAWKIVKKFQDTENTFHRPGRGRKRSVRSPQLLKNPREKRQRKPSPKLQSIGYRSRCNHIHHSPGIEERCGGKALQDAASPGAYGKSCVHESPKLQENPPGDGGTVQNFVFTDEKKFDIQEVVNQQNDRVWASSSSIEERIVTRRQNPQSVMVWAAVTETGRLLSALCALCCQIELPALHRRHFGGLPAARD